MAIDNIMALNQTVIKIHDQSTHRIESGSFITAQKFRKTEWTFIDMSKLQNHYMKVLLN